ncbi:MAG: uncharacterized protein JWO11_795 [Nocardioides sp.]|nr:uncharacterized protein [Nocardioides sp.]
MAPAATVAELVGAVRRHGHSSSDDGGTGRDASSVRPLLVVAAHPGAGATTVAVALADALGVSDTGGGVELIDAAPSETSGLIGVAQREVVGPNGEWRAGQRGTVVVRRPTLSPQSLGELPQLLALAPGARAVIDAGSAVHGLDVDPATLSRDFDVLLVCRATVPGVRLAEGALKLLPVLPPVAVVGARHWPSVVQASLGPILAEVVDDGRAVLIPTDRDLQVRGVGADPLPRPVVAAAARLAELIWPDTDIATHQHRRRGHLR